MCACVCVALYMAAGRPCVTHTSKQNSGGRSFVAAQVVLPERTSQQALDQLWDPHQSLFICERAAAPH